MKRSFLIFYLFLLLFIIVLFINKKTNLIERIDQKYTEKQNAAYQADDSVFHLSENHALAAKRKALFYDEDENKNESYNHYIIIASFSNKENALIFQTELKEQGLNAQVIRSDFDHFKISVFSSLDKQVALDSLEKLRQVEEYKAAWLLKRKL